MLLQLLHNQMPSSRNRKRRQIKKPFMPRLLNLRALCAFCEKAEARFWSIPHNSPLCKSCAQRDDKAFPIRTPSVVAALCGHCGVAPATKLAVQRRATLCEICAAAAKGEVVSLREAEIVEDIVFDKMDFSMLNCQGKGGSAVHRTESSKGHSVDLSYYKTQVPSSIVKDRKRAADAGHIPVPSSSSPRRRRR